MNRAHRSIVYCKWTNGDPILLHKYGTELRSGIRIGGVPQLTADYVAMSNRREMMMAQGQNSKERAKEASEEVLM